MKNRSLFFFFFRGAVTRFRSHELKTPCRAARNLREKPEPQTRRDCTVWPTGSFTDAVAPPPASTRHYPSCHTAARCWALPVSHVFPTPPQWRKLFPQSCDIITSSSSSTVFSLSLHTGRVVPLSHAHSAGVGQTSEVQKKEPFNLVCTRYQHLNILFLRALDLVLGLEDVFYLCARY